MKISFAILAIITFLGLIGCKGVAFYAPTRLDLTDSPVMVTAEDLSTAYTIDSTAADEMFKGKQIQLVGARVEKVQAWFYSGAGYAYDIPPEIKGPEDYYIEIKSVVFKPVDAVYLQQLTTGSIVDIVGTCQGIFGGTVIVDNCWIKLMGGEFDAGGNY